MGKKKEDTTRKLVQMQMGRDDIKGYGYNQAMKRSWKKVMTRFLILLAIVMTTSYFNVTWLAMVFSMAMFAYLLVWMIKCQVAGKKLWLSVKDKPEPIEL